MAPKKLAILVPVAHHISMQCQQGLDGLAARGATVIRLYGNASIDDARNRLITSALSEGYDDFLWVDADIGFSPSDVFHLRSLDLPMVGGIYVKKGVSELACCLLPGTKKVVLGEGGSVFEVLYAPTGFLYTKAEVYEKIREVGKLPICNTQKFPVVPYFLPVVLKDGSDSFSYLSEDFSFCHRARAAGYKIMVDSRVRLWHEGSHTYGWEELNPRPRHQTFTATVR